jgi:hypothetical protein
MHNINAMQPTNRQTVSALLYLWRFHNFGSTVAAAVGG